LDNFISAFYSLTSQNGGPIFTDQLTSVFGEKLRQQVEDRLKFYETGEIPRKNTDVMEEAVEEVQQVGVTLRHCMDCMARPHKKFPALKMDRSQLHEYCIVSLSITLPQS
jgi:hypothetical protein